MGSKREVESMTLGEKLQRLRKARGMSQEELAAQMGEKNRPRNWGHPGPKADTPPSSGAAAF